MYVIHLNVPVIYSEIYKVIFVIVELVWNVWSQHSFGRSFRTSITVIEGLNCSSPLQPNLLSSLIRDLNNYEMRADLTPRLGSVQFRGPYVMLRDMVPYKPYFYNNVYLIAGWAKIHNKLDPRQSAVLCT